jgi:hypothetical protein
MPWTTFDPNYGVREDATEQEKSAERMRDFLFRKELTDRRMREQQDAFSTQERMANTELATKAAMQSQALDADERIKGAFGDRAAHESSMLDRDIGGRKDLAHIGGTYDLEGKRVAIQPEMMGQAREDRKFGLTEKLAAPDLAEAEMLAGSMRGGEGVRGDLQDQMIRGMMRKRYGEEPDAVVKRDQEKENRAAQLRVFELLAAQDPAMASALGQKLGVVPEGFSLPALPRAQQMAKRANEIAAGSQASAAIGEALAQNPLITNWSAKILSSFEGGAPNDQIKKYFDDAVIYLASQTGAEPSEVRNALLARMGGNLDNTTGANLEQFFSYPISSIGYSIAGKKLPGAKTKYDILAGQ